MATSYINPDIDTDGLENIEAVRALFGFSDLYTLYTKMDGDEIIFDPIFIQKIRYALTSMHTSQMSKKEKRLFDDMIDYQSNGILHPRNNTSAGNLANLLDDYLDDATICRTVESDYESHTWETCPQ